MHFNHLSQFLVMWLKKKQYDAMVTVIISMESKSIISKLTVPK